MSVDSDPRADLRWGTTSRLVRDVAIRRADADVVVDGDVRLTGRELDDAVDAIARAVVAAGVEAGDRVAVWGQNSARWMIAALGLQRAGAVLVPLNTRFLGEEAAYILAKSRARLLFTVSDFLGRDYAATLAAQAGGYGDGHPIANLPELRQVIVMSGSGGEACVSWDEFVDSGTGVSDAQVAEREAGIQPDDLSDILFTSGTTGRPKGAMCTHGQTLRAYAVWSQVVGLREGDRYLIVNPFFHGFGYKAGWLASLMTGATIIPAATLDVPVVLDTIRRERISVLPGTPTLYQTLLEHPAFSPEAVSSLRLAVTGAANVPPALLYRLKESLGFDDVVTGYGLTESCAIVAMCRHDDPLEVVASSCGRPLPGLEVRVVDAAGDEVARGEEGEIVVRGYTVMRGYLDEPEETAATIDADGWLHTGDIGTMNAEGLLHITDRLKDMFIVGGFNVYPAEVEQILSNHEAVAQVAVVGVPDERMGEVGAAFVVPRNGATVTPDDLVAYSREHMANYKVPRQVHVVDELPLNASGKVLKNVLRDRLLPT
ncbi:MAG TPA: FadD3 family acyl-CoA ligase [Mycobacteriales bacterium]|nr:FadD3 family acyl-CoA ligase [Mycobacteriales bacterium]